MYIVTIDKTKLQFIVLNQNSEFLFVTLEHKTSHKGTSNLNIEKIIFKVVQMKFLAMHITNHKLCFDILMVRNVLNIFMEHDLYVIS